ncbi:MAG: Asp-tRNA(Asn)/Glu-tRNA(Gln) amidotransferase subunit GatA [Planctomycetota bacterium]
MSLKQTSERVRAGAQRSVELVEAALKAASEQKSLNAFIDLHSDRARARATEVDKRIAIGDDPGPLAGVPVAIKDNLCTAHGRTTCASRMLEHYRSPFDATAVARLESAGAVVIGKTNLDEFAMGSCGEHSAFGATRNPRDPERVPGGSSSGSAAAVAAGIVPLALGSDTGGSIRQPAALCGLVGLKPTYGRVSRWGLVAFASSLDQIGPLAESVEDAALALSVLAGHDDRDATSARREVEPYHEGLDDTGELTVGVCRGLLDSDAVHPSVRVSYESAIDALAADGVTIREIELGMNAHAVAAYYLIAPAEASANLARFDGVRYGHRARVEQGEGLEAMYARSRAEGFGPEVKRRIMLGTHALSSGYHDEFYIRASRARRLIADDYARAFDGGADVILTPTTPGPAFRIGEKSSDPLALYLEDVFTVGANLAGLPAISVPFGTAEVDGSELPLGVQLLAPAWQERTLLRAARRIERLGG